MQEKYKEALDSFAKLLEIMDTLREKCPWDRKQTNLSLKPNTIEEVYELAQAIEDNDTEVEPDMEWEQATNSWKRIHDVLEFTSEKYEKS